MKFFFGKRRATMNGRIGKYSFGRMTVDGEEFRSDLIIRQDGRIKDNWWRKEGHNLLPEDIAPALTPPPEELIIGTGASGLMKVSSDVLKLCEDRKIKVTARKTAEAAKYFNEAITTGKSVVACFHLTC